MARLYNVDSACEFGGGTSVVPIVDAEEYAEALASESVQAYIDWQKQGQTKEGAFYKNVDGTNNTTTKETQMANTEINTAATQLVEETKLNAKIIGGDLLLDNIQTVAEKIVLSRLSWWQKLTITSKQKELAVTVATYALVKAIQTGGFGLTKYRINHEALEYVTLAANARMLKYIVSAVGVNTNIAEMFLKVPEITTVQV